MLKEENKKSLKKASSSTKTFAHLKLTIWMAAFQSDFQISRLQFRGNDQLFTKYRHFVSLRHA